MMKTMQRYIPSKEQLNCVQNDLEYRTYTPYYKKLALHILIWLLILFG